MGGLHLLGEVLELSLLSQVVLALQPGPVPHLAMLAAVLLVCLLAAFQQGFAGLAQLQRASGLIWMEPDLSCELLLHKVNWCV